MYSIVIPSYNRKHALRTCVESLLTQTYRDLEIIVVDDGSTDGTAELFANTLTDTRIRYLPQTTNAGAYQARNIGIEAATGDYLLHWDSDDTLFPNALERLDAFRKEHPDADILSATTLIKHGDEQRVSRRLPTGPVSYEDYLRGILPDNVVIWLIKRSVATTARFEAPNIDFMYFHRLIKHYRWYHLDEDLGIVYLLSDALSETRVRRIPNTNKSIARAKALVPFLQEHREEYVRIAPERYVERVYGACIGTLLSGNRPLAHQLAQEMQRLVPTVKHQALVLFTMLPGSTFLLRSTFQIKRWFALTF